jgi:hypothetical protein
MHWVEKRQQHITGSLTSLTHQETKTKTDSRIDRSSCFIHRAFTFLSVCRIFSVGNNTIFVPHSSDTCKSGPRRINWSVKYDVLTCNFQKIKVGSLGLHLSSWLQQVPALKYVERLEWGQNCLEIITLVCYFATFVKGKEKNTKRGGQKVS